MNRLIEQAFTLIELLVVIAIIGILSGLIIVSMSGVTQKATIAKAQVFSNSLRNSLMLNIVGEWKMDEGSGTATNDTWGGLNNGTLSGFADTTAGYGDNHTSGWMSSSNCISGTCLNFDGIDNYVYCGSNSILKLGNTGTITAWIYPTGDTSIQRIIYGSSGGADVNKPPYFGITTNGKLIADLGDGSTVQLLTSNLSTIINQWQLIGLSWDGTTAKIYLNTSLYSVPQTSPNAFTGASYSIGVTTAFPTRIFSGRIDDVRIYNAAIPVSQIKEQYYAGLNKLLISGQLTQKEYLSRFHQLAVKSLD